MTAVTTYRGGRRLRIWAALILGSLAVSGALGSVVLLVWNGYTLEAMLFGFTLGGAALGVSFGLLGIFLVARVPGNALGWVFLVVAVSQGLDSLFTQWAEWALITSPGRAAGALADWFASWTWAPGAALFGTLTLLLFPTGRPPSGRWRWVTRLVLAAIALMVAPTAVASWPSRGRISIRPQPPAETLGGLPELLTFAGLVLVVVAMAASLVSLAHRYRRSEGFERQQIKWLLFAGGVTAPLAGLIFFRGGPEQFGELGIVVGVIGLILSGPSIAIAVAIAILRYRLYEIDRLISRTVSYGSLTALLVTIYIGLVFLLRELLPVQGELPVATSTLAVAALFHPMRRRVQALVDRRFNRNRYDASLVVEELTAHLRDHVELETVTAEMLDAAGRALQPVSLSVWVRESRS